MKQFLLKTGVFLFTILCPLIVLNYLYVNTSYYAHLNDLDKFIQIPNSVDVCNFGSSHGFYGFNYEHLGKLTGFNFALQSQIFFYDEVMFHFFKSKLKHGSIVLLSISYMSFNRPYESFSRMKPRYYVLFGRNMKDYSFEEDFCYRIFPLLSANNKLFNFLYKEYVLKIEYEKKFTSCNRYSIDELNKIGGKRAINHINDIYENKHAQNQCKNDLLRIIRECKKYGFNPVLITTPFTDFYNRPFSEELMNQFYANIYEISEKEDVIYLDYSHDPEFRDYNLYRDTDHLNDIGAKMFTNKVIKDLMGLGFLQED